MRIINGTFLLSASAVLFAAGPVKAADFPPRKASPVDHVRVCDVTFADVFDPDASEARLRVQPDFGGGPASASGRATGPAPTVHGVERRGLSSAEATRV